MLRLAKNFFGLLAAIVLMAVLGTIAFVLWRSNPEINIGLFFAAMGIFYTMIILFVLAK